jgi:hypothetical protein
MLSSKPWRALGYCGLATLAAISILCFECSLPLNRVVTSRDTYVEPERYELCNTDAEIQALQQKYNLIVVSSTPTKAAMHPGWPETMISFLLSCVTIAVTANKEFGLLQRVRRGRQPRRVSFRHGPSVTERILHIVNMALLSILSFAWTVSFALVIREGNTGGWISVLAWTSTAIYVASVDSLEFEAIHDNMFVGALLVGVVLLLPMAMFQWCGSIAVMIKRWTGDIGGMAYIINDPNSCVPYSEFDFLQKGARGRQFRIIQTAEFLWSCVFMFFQMNGRDVEEETRMDGEERRSFGCTVAMVLFVIYVPVLVYEIIIASLGRPVVISGNCMLVELDPKFGFLDSGIETWWKALTSITGF